jgi:hypothetical protein
MWLAGKIRGLTEDDRIGFHAAYYGSNGKVSSEANAMVGAYLNRLGFSYRTIHFLTYAAPDSMQWLTSENAKQYGIDADIYPSLRPKSARTDWQLFIPAIVMGIFVLGFIKRAQQKEVVPAGTGGEGNKMNMKKFFDVHPAKMAGMMAINVLFLSWMDGSLNCWPCLLGTSAAGMLVWLIWLIWRNSVLSEKTWKERALPVGRLTAFDKALLSALAMPVIGILVLIVCMIL